MFNYHTQKIEYVQIWNDDFQKSRSNPTFSYSLSISYPFPFKIRGRVHHAKL